MCVCVCVCVCVYGVSESLFQNNGHEEAKVFVLCNMSFFLTDNCHYDERYFNAYRSKR